MALSDANGDTVQTYEYNVYGEVAVEDANHTNPYMFAGRRFDIEIGLYYNRSRYYNPFTGRFLQTDPIGYGDGMNIYAYCGNSPLINVDPSGLRDEQGRLIIAFYDGSNPNYVEAADDAFFDLAIDMRSLVDNWDDTTWILEILEFLTTIGEEIGEVYFFDDSEVEYRNSGPHVTALEFGDAKLKVEENGDLQVFFAKMGEFVDPNGTIHLRQSFAAQEGDMNPGWLGTYGAWAGCTVTAVNGAVAYDGVDEHGVYHPEAWEQEGRDYRFIDPGGIGQGDGTVWSSTVIILPTHEVHYQVRSDPQPSY